MCAVIIPVAGFALHWPFSQKGIAGTTLMVWAFCGVGYSKGKNALEGQAGFGLTTVEQGMILDISVHILEPAQ